MIAPFLAWFDLQRHRFVLPLSIIDATTDQITLEFTTGLTVTVGRQGVGVWVDDLDAPGSTWDLLYEFEALPMEQNGRWHCHWCVDCPKPEVEPLRYYDSRDALLIDHVFEPLLAWANGSLAMADCVELYRDQDGCTWAKLVSGDADPEARHCLHRLALR